MRNILPVAVLDVVIHVGLVLATIFLFGIVTLAYARLRNGKISLIFTGFGIFDRSIDRVECLSEQLTLEEGHRLFKEVFQENLEKKRFTKK